MKQPNHTNGPWTIRDRADGGLSIKAGESCLIARVALQPAAHVANAHLIASAPDLLAAAVAMLRLMVDGQKATQYELETFATVINRANGMIE